MAAARRVDGVIVVPLMGDTTGTGLYVIVKYNIFNYFMLTPRVSIASTELSTGFGVVLIVLASILTRQSTYFRLI